MSKTNTNFKYISKTSKGYSVHITPDVSLANGGIQKLTRKNLKDAVYARNLLYGFDVDAPPVPGVPEISIAPGQSTVRFAALGDTHLGSKYEALDALHSFYSECYQRGIEVFFHAGNFIDGHKHPADVHTWGLTNQAKYFIDHYPRVTTYVASTYLITGDDHEGHYLHTEGIDAGEYTCALAEKAGRFDLHYAGYVQADFVMGGFKVRLVHGGGGSAAAVSWAGQRIVDSLPAGEIPDVLLVGHYHKAVHVPNYRGCDIILTGAFQYQSPFMRKKNLQSTVGGWIVELSRNSAGLIRVQAEFLSYPTPTWKGRP